MHGLLQPSHYTDPETFADETTRIFGQLWIFAGFAQLVSQSDQYLTRQIGGRQVVVQNMDGRLHAFENVCAHRSKLLQTEPFGCRSLVCGYHGWRYAADGSVTLIPFESECYEFELRERRALGLRTFAMERVGKLLFVNVSDDPIPLASQFTSELLDSLESVSNAFDDEILVARFEGRYNWKLAYENLRDGLHPRFVHTKSLNREVRFEVQVPDSILRSEENVDSIRLSQLSFGGAEGMILEPKELPFHTSVIRWGDQDAYFNWLLYPNTHVVCPDGGYSFSIEHHEPIGPDRTAVTLFFVTAKKHKPYSGAAAVLWEYAQAAKSILDEDSAVMEQAQHGLATALRPVKQGRYEMRNRITDRWYLHRMVSEPDSNPKGRIHG